ncbi:MAG: hypothetical protein NT085_00570 [candidate division SR1 bacterium]|nr:hypothetical protein [candidate division SR1 bacterium]
MKNKKICPHPFYTDDRIETKILKELCNLGILDERHALLCFPDSATIHIGYLDTKEMNPKHIPSFDGTYIKIYLYCSNNPVGANGTISTFKEMQLFSLIYSNWGPIVTALLPSVSQEEPSVYEKAKENVATWNA